ncbi:ABC transporter permease [Undibacterium pigrum]|uniref:Putative ABC transport system permease protein n=1 Tax=Undibacterium pigrum TaxID=401470 RepID=A0A318J702_9BURK|nr:FtsX-like permease family protein [Undibacterium pigrum]PXX42138.1 putative ABC transport system permease protein [Undibacterium pigrum]
MKLNFEIRPIFSALLRSKTGAILVALQVAISLAILANAVYIVQLRMEVVSRPSGVAEENDLFSINVSNRKLAEHAEQIATQKHDEAIIRGVSGVQDVTRVSQTPLSWSGSSTGVSLDRKQAASSSSVSMYVVSQSVMKLWGLKLTDGRDFNQGEFREIDANTSKDFPDVVIITKATAEKLFPGQASVVGKNIYFGTGDDAKETRIIGVLDRLQTHGAQIGAKGEISVVLPTRMSNDPYSKYSVRAEPGQRDRVMKDVEVALRKASATPLIINLRSMENDRTRRYRADNGLAWMLIAVCVLLLLVTASGIVGISSLWVTQRRKHIGVRRALGARRIDVLRYFITENFMITSFGIACGVALAIGLNQLLVSKLELTKLPVAYLLGASVIFWILGIIAVVGPAARAASISPATATRST